MGITPVPHQCSKSSFIRKFLLLSNLCLHCCHVNSFQFTVELKKKIISSSFTSLFHYLRLLLSCFVMDFSKWSILVSSTLPDRSSFLVNPLDYHWDRTLKLHFELGTPFLEFLERFQLPICSLWFCRLALQLIEIPRRSVKSWVQYSTIWIAQKGFTVMWVILCDVVEIKCIVNCAFTYVLV